MDVSKHSEHLLLKAVLLKAIFLNTHFTFAFIVYGPYSTQLTTLMQMTGLTAEFARECEKYFYGKANSRKAIHLET